jgi:hypothetical protein
MSVRSIPTTTRSLRAKHSLLVQQRKNSMRRTSKRANGKNSNTCTLRQPLRTVQHALNNECVDTKQNNTYVQCVMQELLSGSNQRHSGKQHKHALPTNHRIANCCHTRPAPEGHIPGLLFVHRSELLLIAGTKGEGVLSRVIQLRTSGHYLYGEPVLKDINFMGNHGEPGLKDVTSSNPPYQLHLSASLKYWLPKKAWHNPS